MESVKSKTGVLLINLGTPDSPSVRDVRTYLSEFLNDPRVIDIPKLLRLMLVNLIIVPFRAPKSAKIYKELWTDKGSPLLFHSKRVEKLLDEQLGDDYTVYLAMRYKNPNIRHVLEEMRRLRYSKIVLLPMFPQYASATTGSVHDEVMRLMRKEQVIPPIKMINSYHDNEDMLDIFVENSQKFDLKKYDHILFSFQTTSLFLCADVKPAEYVTCV